jgi:hypothetical protein
MGCWLPLRVPCVCVMRCRMQDARWAQGMEEGTAVELSKACSVLRQELARERAAHERAKQVLPACSA